MKKGIGRIVALAMATSAGHAQAAEWRLGEDAQAKVNGAVTLGTGIRTEEPRPETTARLLVAAWAAATALPARIPAGRTSRTSALARPRGGPNTVT